MKHPAIANKGKSSQACRPRSRWRFLKVSGAVLAALLTLLAVTLLWKPAVATRDGAPPDFLKAVGNTEIPPAIVEYLAKGKTTVTLTEAQITDIAAGALDRNSKTVPFPVANAIHKNVPSFVETVVGCTIRGEDVTLCARCRMGVPVYGTVSGVLALKPDGDLTFRPVRARLGMLPVPLGMAAEQRALEEQVLFARGQEGVVITKMTPGQGRITLELESSKGVE